MLIDIIGCRSTRKREIRGGYVDRRRAKGVSAKPLCARITREARAGTLSKRKRFFFYLGVISSCESPTKPMLVARAPASQPIKRPRAPTMNLFPRCNSNPPYRCCFCFCFLIELIAEHMPCSVLLPRVTGAGRQQQQPMLIASYARRGEGE